MTKLAALLAIATIAGCGDNKKPEETGSPDSGIDAPPPVPRAVIVSGDFTPGHPGVMSALDPATREVMTNVAPTGAVGDDPVLRHYGSELLVVNRNDSNNVTILDDQTFQLVEQLATGAGTNPQDVAVVGEKLFVATFSKKGAVVLTRGSTVVTEIDLSADDPDGEPNCASVFYAFNKLYFACGLLDDTMMFKPPRGPGKVYVVNPSNLHVDATITLTTNNPIALFEQIPPSSPHGNDLLMPTIDFNTGMGCIERVSESAAAGCLIDNSMLGGFAYASRIAFSGTHARVGAADFPKGNVLDLELAAGTLGAQPMTPTSQVVGDVAVCPGGQMVVTDTTMATNGLRVYEGTTEKTTAPIAIGLKPNSSHGLVCY